MSQRNALKEADREFLTLVTQAAFANPFSEDRKELDRKLSGIHAIGDGRNPAEEAIKQVRRCLERLARTQGHEIDTYSDEDRETIRYAHLYDVFHAFLDNFDALIRRQIETGDAVCDVTFGADAIRTLASRGFARADAARYLAMFYQLRRAYYFISEALAGNCESMRKLRCALWNNVFTRDITVYETRMWNRMEDFSTLLLGDTGTGKGAAATAIGRSGFIPYDLRSQRFTESFTQSFISINLSEFSEALIESELFGHKKGAFTGAVDAHKGIFSRCSPHGAIFLDEIGDVTVPVQTKLLRVLQERTFTPVGSHSPLRFNGRVIAATNKPLDALRSKNLFRDDFFYRLCSDIIVVPTLQRRITEDPEELHILINHLLLRILGEAAPELSDLAIRVIQRDLGKNYAWPGNVRELEQCVRRILLTHECSPLTKTTGSVKVDALKSHIDAGTYTAAELLSDYCTRLYERYGTYEDVARRTALDRRTVKRYIERSDEA